MEKDIYNMIVTWIVRKSPAFYGARIFVNVFEVFCIIRQRLLSYLFPADFQIKIL
jgi:predicted DNA-binding protein (UPF0278 family)